MDRDSLVPPCPSFRNGRVSAAIPAWRPLDMLGAEAGDLSHSSHRSRGEGGDDRAPVVGLHEFPEEPQPHVGVLHTTRSCTSNGMRLLEDVRGGRCMLPAGETWVPEGLGVDRLKDDSSEPPLPGTHSPCHPSS